MLSKWKVIAVELKKKQGFTLIELMITVAIVAILAAIAYPSYQQYVIRGNRAAAQAQMMDIASRQQQFLLANRAYADKDTLEDNGYSLPSDVAARYDYDVEAVSDTLPSFVVTFTAKGAQEDDGDLTLNSAGVKAPSGKW
ncbi:type IV pilin protein [Azotobacter beijerinckii]|uniref:type IV pilin protein n=1 Tax=Azotobacter beijerinckii TaxID=170623 RepID=UPI0029531CF7|nr:type IV pilin protein [Azotobacter beijerinckii]MDV7210387.1 type IV pilin protein [Azotobacter beijerinckii]